eukprot:COSAG01_NODE_2300_length_7954_cov_7.117250_3_plen_118_part_00
MPVQWLAVWRQAADTGGTCGLWHCCWAWLRQDGSRLENNSLTFSCLVLVTLVPRALVVGRVRLDRSLDPNSRGSKSRAIAAIFASLGLSILPAPPVEAVPRTYALTARVLATSMPGR